MQQLMQGLYNIVTKIQPVTYLLVAIALVICGVMFIVPSGKIQRKSERCNPMGIDWLWNYRRRNDISTGNQQFICILKDGCYL